MREGRQKVENLVSIVLPVYNGERYLASAIESVLNQTYQNIELILVNDCSTDSTEEIIQSYASKDPRIVYLKNEVNLKLPASLNRGFSAAKGQYLTWTSDDNLYMPTALARMTEFLEQHPKTALVYCDMDEINDSGTVTRRITVGEPDRLLYVNTVGACFMYRKQAAEVVGEYDPNCFLVEDYEYWLRFYLAFQISPLHECLYQYRFHSGALTSTRQTEIQTAVKKLRLNYLPVFEKNHLPNRLLFPYFDYLFEKNIITENGRQKKLQFAARHPSYFLTLIRKKLKKGFH